MAVSGDPIKIHGLEGTYATLVPLDLRTTIGQVHKSIAELVTENRQGGSILCLLLGGNTMRLWDGFHPQRFCQGGTVAHQERELVHAYVDNWPVKAILTASFCNATTDVPTGFPLSLLSIVPPCLVPPRSGGVADDSVPTSFAVYALTLEIPGHHFFSLCRIVSMDKKRALTPLAFYEVLHLPDDCPYGNLMRANRPKTFAVARKLS